MNLLLHPVAKGAINQLVLLHHILSAEFRADNDGVEMVAIITFHVHEFARHGSFDMGFNAVCCNHSSCPFMNNLCQRRNSTRYLLNGGSCNPSSAFAMSAMIPPRSSLLQSRG